MTTIVVAWAKISCIPMISIKAYMNRIFIPKLKTARIENKKNCLGIKSILMLLNVTNF